MDLWSPDTVQSLEKTLRLGKVEGKRRRRRQKTRGECEGQRVLACYSPQGHRESRHNLATEEQQTILEAKIRYFLGSPTMGYCSKNLLELWIKITVYILMEVIYKWRAQEQQSRATVSSEVGNRD